LQRTIRYAARRRTGTLAGHSGIAHGQYWLNVRFESSLIRVPFCIMTKDEANEVEKN
jgi:hypothetical protein